MMWSPKNLKDLMEVDLKNKKMIQNLKEVNQFKVGLQNNHKV